MAAQATTVLGHPVDGPRDLHARPGRAQVGAGLPDGARRDLLAMFDAYDRAGLVGGSAWLWALLGHRPTTWSDALRASPDMP